jgi:TonB family protein
MMSAYANSLQKPENFDSYVRKFRVICVTHGLQIGSRDDLHSFLQKLAVDRHLAMDFWAFIGKLSDREGGELNDDQILAVIVEGIVKDEVSHEDAELNQSVDDLRAMLAGVDVHGPVPIEPAPFRNQSDSFLNHQEDKWPSQRPVKAADTSQNPESFVAGEPVVHPANVEALILPQLDQALHRLELTNLELKHHLSEIDRRMSRLEPQLDELAPLKTDSTGNRPVADSRFARMEELAHKPGSSGRLVLEPAIPAPEEEPFGRNGRPSAQIPLENYAQQQGYGKAVAALLFVLALAVAGYRYREPLQQEFSALVQKIQTKIQTTTKPANTASSTDESGVQQDTPQPAPDQSLQGISTPPPVNAGARNKPGQTIASTRTSAESDSKRRSIADRVATQAQALPDGISNADLAGAVRVSPAVMESRLVDSRVPAYPDSAKVAGVEGSVIMQAIISRDGRVKRVHVTQGDSRLRGPAVDAVYKWRYRPYLLDGQPVDVATTISVDFDLDR